MGKFKGQEEDFDFENITKEISKQKNKKGFNAGDIIGFVMNHKLLIAIIAVYLIASGIAFNVIEIIRLITFLIKL